jgi:hypothetical protein
VQRLKKQLGTVYAQLVNIQSAIDSLGEIK